MGVAWGLSYACSCRVTFVQSSREEMQATLENMSASRFLARISGTACWSLQPPTQLWPRPCSPAAPCPSLGAEPQRSGWDTGGAGPFIGLY